MSFEPNNRPYEPPPVDPNSLSNGYSQGSVGSGYDADPYNGQTYGEPQQYGSPYGQSPQYGSAYGQGNQYGSPNGQGNQYLMVQSGPAMSGPVTYGAPMMMVRPKTNSLAAWSMWLGIIGLGGGFVCSVLWILPIIGTLFLFLSVFLWIAPILAIIFGHVAHRQINTSGEAGRGQATAGLVMGYINIALVVLSLVVVVGFVGLGAMATGMIG